MTRRWIVSLALAALIAVPTAHASPGADPPTWMLAWGNLGSGTSQLNYPSGVATDERGNVYVLDAQNYRIQKFNRHGNLIAKWGNYGFANGEFYNPSGIAVDLNGNVFVADGGNYRIQKFTSAGVYVSQWGSNGTGAGQFNGMGGGPGIDAAGNIYVADGNRVQKFTNNGTFVTQWGSLGSGDGQFNGPTSVAVDAAGYVYVVDRLNSRVEKFTSTGAFVTKWSLGGNTYGIAVDAVGDVYIADDNAHITRYSATGTFEVQWGSAGSGNGQLNGPKSLAVDLEGNVYVADSWNHRIQKFSGSGATLGQPAPGLILTWGTLGTGDGSLDTPRGVAIDASGNVYVSDTGNQRIQEFTSTGGYIRKWGSFGGNPGQFHYPNQLALDPAGNVYVADDFNDRIQKFSPTGGLLLQWGSNGNNNGQFYNPTGIAIDAASNVYVADMFNARIQKFTSGGAFVSKWGTLGLGAGQFENPTHVAVDAFGSVYVTESYAPSRVQKFDGSGVLLAQVGSTGSGDGQLNGPWGVAIDPFGNVFVSEWANERMQGFTAGGSFLTKWGSQGGATGQFQLPSGVAIDPAGNIYIADNGNSRIQKFASPPAIAQVSDVRNDQGRQARLRILRCSADSPGSGATITGYAIFRRIDPPPAALASTRERATPQALALAGWDYVTTVPAFGDAEYDVVVPTLADANSTTRAYTAFFVRAMTPAPLTYYDSGIESGYSIDNLSPPAPSPFLAAFLTGATHLHWGVSTASDFATFRLYRGATSNFTPGAGNLVAATTDTGYVDSGAPGSYYKLVAVDLNGNESPYALVGPNQTTDVGDDGVALEFALDPIRPNPVRGRDLAVAFALPTAGEARLELIDVAGRRVADQRVTGAGRHTVSLGARGLPAGVYLIRLSQGASVRTRRAVVFD